MKFCQPHFGELKKLVISKGMGGLIESDEDAVAERARAEVDGTAMTDTYDPLMAAHWMLIGRAFELGGFYLLESKPGDGDGHYCPMCEVEEQGTLQDLPGAAQHWMEGCTDAVLIYCRENGLLSKPQ